jgi:hypothetical protein
MSSSLAGSTGYKPSLSGSGKSGNQLKGSGYKAGQLQNFTPEQMQLFQQLFSNVGPDSYTSRLAGGDQSIFNEIEQPAMKQFSELQGNLASRFSGMGSGARKSSGFQNTSNQAASDFASQLQSQRQGLQRQAIQDLFGMSNDLLNQRPYQQFLYEKEKPWYQTFGENFSGEFSKSLGRNFGGGGGSGDSGGGGADLASLAKFFV